MSLVSVPYIKQRLLIDHDDDNLILAEMVEEAETELQLYVDKTIVLSVSDSTTETELTPLMRRFIYLHVALSYEQRIPATDKALSKVPFLALDNLIMQVRDGK